MTLAVDLRIMRGQECDRVKALAVELAKTGAPVVEGADWLAVFPRNAISGEISLWIKENLRMQPVMLHVDGVAIQFQPVAVAGS